MEYKESLPFQPKKRLNRVPKTEPTYSWRDQGAGKVRMVVCSFCCLFKSGSLCSQLFVKGWNGLDHQCCAKHFRHYYF